MSLEKIDTYASRYEENGRPRIYDVSYRLRHGHNLMKAQHEALRRTTLLKHRKISTQLKLDVLHRQLNESRRSSSHKTDTDQFYQRQLDELNNQLRSIGATLERAERDTYYVRRKLIRRSGLDFADGFSSILTPLSSSQPSIATCKDHSVTRFSKSNLKSRGFHILPSPPRTKRKYFGGQLRAVASLSSLRSKSPSPSPDDDPLPAVPKESKHWKGRLRAIGNFMDSVILKKIGLSMKRTKSAETVLETKSHHLFRKRPREDKISELISDLQTPFSDDIHDRLSCDFSDSESSDEEEEDEVLIADDEAIDLRHDTKITKTEKNDKKVIDPAVLAEIEEFEKMAALYISQHKQEFPS